MRLVIGVWGLLFLCTSIAKAEGYHYVGYGFGGSYVEPSTKNTPRLEVTENTDFSHRIYAGYQSGNGFGIEMEFVELGQAVIEDPFSSFSGEIDYQFYGVSGIYNLPVNDQLEVYGKLGVGTLKNKSHGDVEYVQVHDVQAYVGAGLKAEIAPDYYINAEVAQYDADAASFTLNIETRWSNNELMTSDLKEMMQD